MVLDPIKQRYWDLVDFFRWMIPTYVPTSSFLLVGQRGPRPPNPMIAFQPISSVERVGMDERRVDDLGVETLRGQRRIVCDLFAFSDSESRFDGEENAWDMLQAIRTALGFPEVVERLNSISCRVLDEGVVTNVSETMNTTNEPRAYLQITFSTAILQSIDSGQISTVNTSGQLQGSNSSLGVSFTSNDV